MRTPALFLRLPREIRDLIYDLVFDTAPSHWLYPTTIEARLRTEFPHSWIGANVANRTTLSHNFPALCCVSRQVFLESTPKFMTRLAVFTSDKQEMKLLYRWLGQFPRDEGFEAILDFSSFGWDMLDQEATDLQIDLFTRMKNLTYLDIVFEYPEVVDGMEEAKYNWQDEQYNMTDLGVSYPPKWFYTEAIRYKWPLDAEDLKQEKHVLNKELHQFIDKNHLTTVLELSKLEIFEFQFHTQSGGLFRHNLCNVLFKWFKEEFDNRGMGVDILTGFHEC